ncbi:2-hydroxyacylsphingosine 1-beta-galactosyltransferase-like [Thrips palmi]|uniref:2-hydroxyacylsphingosine 1-beta-galactosyltransferase-like n=1 Tax=Thrips palmi TaxID=161013 RepID=A0A6P8XVJ8_THRPL|nr:2-hydroxyacylsphingosine 1-beta-galactosyltransferase-like [Thrips palmi]XP_034231005.1 2-hydroxyacylsphingosine 1-beta-galactosyltransferase-like [Thrips palmi]
MATLVTLAALAALSCAAAAPLNVLLVSTVSSPSHYIWTNALATGLLERGHRVTELVIRPPAVKHENRTSFVITAPTYGDEHGWDLEVTNVLSLWEEIPFFYSFCVESAKAAFESQAFTDLMKHLKEKKPKFDVFVLDFIMQEPMIGLNSVIGRVPVVAFTAFNMPEEVLQAMGSPFVASMLPFQGVGADGGVPMTFRERADNAFKWLTYKLYAHYVDRPRINQDIAKWFPGAPSLEELEKDLAISLVNTSPPLHGGMPTVPAVVEVGGLQAQPPKPLPKDLLDWVDAKNAPHGFIYMAFGTNVKAKMIRKERRDAILRAFGRLKQRVLWKYEDDDIHDKLPPNVKVAKWLPQNDILGHPNIRCFVSHNGGLSTQEASYHGVPIVGVPFFVDQIGYSHKIEKIGIGRRVHYQSITEDSFFETVFDVANNPKYRENMQKVRQALRDQKETPLERAVWYIEYAARTGGAPNLRSPGLQLRWYELYMLDLLGAALLAVVLFVWLVSRMVAAFVGLLFCTAPKRAKAKTQ